MDPYKTLGVAPDATPEQIRKAFRKLISKLHPDRDGGDTERAKAVNDAYSLLMDPERRAAYDEDPTGQMTQTRREARSVLLSIIDSICSDDGVIPANFMKVVRKKLGEMHGASIHAAAECQGLIVVLRGQLSRFGSKNAFNPVHVSINRKICTLEEIEQQRQHTAEVLTLAIAMFEGVEDYQESVPTPQFQLGLSSQLFTNLIG